MSERQTFPHSPFSVWGMLCPGPVSPLLKIIQLRKQWYFYPKHCSYPCAHPSVSAQTWLHQGGGLLWTPMAEASQHMSQLLWTSPQPPHNSNLESALFNALYPVTGTMPGTFQELTKCLLTELMKRQVLREATKPKAHNTSRQEDSLMSARQRWLDRPGT